MSRAPLHASPAEQEKPQDKVGQPLPAHAEYRPHPLPTFPLEVGYREVYDPETGAYQQLPLTLLEILYPTEEDVGAVKMAQSPLHNIWTSLLAVMLRSYLAARNWLVLHDVIVHWGIQRAPNKSPDLAVILDGELAAEGERSYRVGRDGPPPDFVVEINSEETRQVDLDEKWLFYAAIGVKEYLIIDLLTPPSAPWRMLGYRLEESPYYREMTADAEGGFVFATVGLRFRPVDRERIEVYDAKTGERLLSLDEARERLQEVIAARVAAEERAEAEAVARTAAEERYENDIATLIHYYRPPLEPLLAEIAKHLSDSDLLSVRQILHDIQQRIERFEGGREDQAE